MASIPVSRVVIPEQVLQTILELPGYVSVPRVSVVFGILILLTDDSDRRGWRSKEKKGRRNNSILTIRYFKWIICTCCVS